MRLVVSIATRGRPERLIETVKRNLENAKLSNTAIFVALDHDDDASNYAMAKFVLRHPSVILSIEQREDTIAEKWNRALKIPGDCYLAVGDDDPIATKGYDELILKAAALFPDGIGMVYGHLANASFSGVVAPTRKFCEKMGRKVFPEYFPYWFCDHWTDDVAKIIGRISFADVKTDQSAVGKTQELREPAWWATWFDAAHLRRREQAHDIINDPEFQCSDSHRKILLGHHPLIEYRSKWINDHVRGRARELEGWSGLKAVDQRYQRVKDKAIALIPWLLDGMEPQLADAYRKALVPATQIIGLQRAFA